MTYNEIKSTLFNTDKVVELGKLTLDDLVKDLDWYFSTEDRKAFYGDQLELQMAFKNGFPAPRLQTVTNSNDTIEIITGWEEFGFEEGFQELIEYCIEKNHIT